MLRVVSQNLCKGVRAGYGDVAALVEAFAPDVLLIQESAQPDKYFRDVLNGWTAHWQPAGGNYWGSAVWLRPGFVWQPFPVDGPYNGWLVAVRLEGPVPIAFASIHVATIKGRSYPLVAQDLIPLLPLAHLAVAGGDWNNLISVPGTNDAVMQYPSGSKKVREMLATEGWINTWRHLNPSDPLPRTYRHLFKLDSPVFHIDAIFVRQGLESAIKAVAVLDDPAWHHSDHHPVVLDLDINI